MKHTKIFALVLAAILSASALCACQSPSPDPADTTPAPPLSDVVDTTPAETTPAETTPTEIPAETTPAEVDDLMSTRTYVGKISSPDNISLEGIKVDVYKVISAKWVVDPSPQISAYLKYDTCYDFSDYEDTFVYEFSVYTDAEGKFSFDSYKYSTAISFDFDSFPKQYGIRSANQDTVYLGEPMRVNSMGPNVPDIIEFALEKIVTAEVTWKMHYEGFIFEPYLLGADQDHNNRLYGKAVISRGRFDDGFVDAMINGTEINYTATVICGDISNYDTLLVRIQNYYVVWEWRVDYLYYNNYIDKAQYDEIYRTTEPSDHRYY